MTKIHKIPLSILLVLTSAAMAGEERPFGIQVIDGETGRGVPMVELQTTNHSTYVTDSAGWVAYREPGLLGSRVHFRVDADGYEHRADGFGYRGMAFDTIPGETGTMTVSRKYAAERLYRITGAGIYRDSVLLGKEVPLENPLLNGRVMGQDSALAVVYNDRIYWFWGDTSRPGHPLGNFKASGAKASLPGDGGLDPSVGVNMEYFVRDDGFTKGVVDVEESGATWLGGLFVIEDGDGNEQLVGRCSRMKSLGEELERFLVIWDDEREVFERLGALPLDVPLAPSGHAFRHEVDGTEYVYFANPYPNIRVHARWDAIIDPAAYEGFTCLIPGERLDMEYPQIERSPDGDVVWGWKADTPPVNVVKQRELVSSGHLEEHERTHVTKDVESGDEITLWGGSVRWNEYTSSWVMLAHQLGGDPSFLGEVWFLKADAPEGPWAKAVKIATHRVHDFYNVVHHDFLDQEGGRLIYFEGTLSGIFAPDAPPIPRYQYNQIMYRLDLADERLRKVLQSDPTD
ncbi:MAG: hypothetical protein JJU11_15875 [Candidatus Sumerlaeia bacterium]|nr:hypothetical protein [Candidatus Sumerlaeia bacterium]